MGRESSPSTGCLSGAAVAAVVAFVWLAASGEVWAAEEPRGDAQPVRARADIAVRWRSGGICSLLLTGHAEVVRGGSRMEADRVLIWIDEARSAQLGRVVMEVYAEGNVVTVEQGTRVQSPRVFFRWTASEFTVDDADGLIPLYKKAFSGGFVERGLAVRRAGAVPPAEAVIPPKERPPVGEIRAKVPKPGEPTGIVMEPARIGLIYGQQQEGPDIQSFMEGDYRVTVVKRYPDIVFYDPGSDISKMEVLAENMVIWVNDKKLREGKPLAEAEVEIYAEGNVVVYIKNKTVQCEQLYYDYRNERGLLSGGPGGTAVIKMSSRSRKVPFYYRAREFRQVSANRYLAKNAITTTSEFAHPEWGIHSKEMELTAGTRTITKEDGTTREEEALERATSRGNWFIVQSLPVFYWPTFTRDLENNRTILKRIRLGHSGQFGFSVLTEWDLYDLGIYENNWSEATLLTDYYSKRGTGVGLSFQYQRPEFFGDLLAYTINDTGIDKNDLPPEHAQRSRFKWRHRQFLSDHWRADAEFSWLTDRQFLNEYWEKEFKEEKDQESLLYLRYLEENRSFMVLGKFRVNDWQTQTERMPEARFVWLGHPLFGGTLTYIQDSRFGNLRRRWDEDLQKRGLLPADYRSWRGITEHEIQWPFRLGIFQIAPFFNATYSYYDRVISGGNDRLALTSGIRSSTTSWKIYDYYNRLWDINRLRHIVTPTLDVFSTFHLTKDAGEVHMFDSLDPVDDVTVIRMGLRQRLQTRRLARREEPALVGGWRNTDWMVLDLELDYYPDEDQNGGRNFSPLEIEYLWRISDRLALVSNADIRVDRGKVIDTFDVGFRINRSPKLLLYLGQRYVADSGSSIFITRADYKLDERWTLGFLGHVDFGLGEANEARITLRRRMHRWIMELGFGRDFGQDDTSIMLLFMPQGVPEAKLRFF